MDIALFCDTQRGRGLQLPTAQLPHDLKSDMILGAHLQKPKTYLHTTHPAFLSPPVLMHGGLICIAFRLSVTLQKSLDKNSCLRKHHAYGDEIWYGDEC